jgi:hypothetical protein
MIPFVAFYQARAEAAPAAPFESTPFHDLILDGWAEKIPLFAYVYHEYGPVRMDGWAKLSREQGDFVYYVLGRTCLQGGLIELNYEFSPLEDLGEHHDVAAEHYWHFEERHYSINAELAGYVGRLAQLRLGPANIYLAYGRMRRPSPMKVPGDDTLDLRYMLYNAAQDSPTYGTTGVMRVPAVLQTAWQHGDNRIAWILLNLTTEERRVEIDLEPLLPVAADALWDLTVQTQNGTREQMGVLAGRRVLSLALPPRLPVLIEALRNDNNNYQ